MPEQHDPFDAKLRDRINAAESRLRVTSTPPDGLAAGRGPARWLRPALVLATTAIAVVLTVFIIGQLPDRSSGDATPSPSATEGVSASARNGDFVLTLSSPRSTWTTRDAIQITATLSYDGDQPEVEIGGGGGPVVFSLIQLEGGNATLGGGQDLPCLRYALGPDAPLIWPFQKSGAVSDEPPFDLAFFQEPELHLPPGRWEARAVLEYGIGDCDDLQLMTSIEIDVRDDGPLPSSSARACPAALASGTLAATDDGTPLLIVGDDVPRVTIVWSYPEDYRIVTTPVLVIFDLEGNELAREGDWVELGGGYGADDTVFHVCGHISREPAPSDPDVDCGNVDAPLCSRVVESLENQLLHANGRAAVSIVLGPPHCFETGGCTIPAEAEVAVGASVQYHATTFSLQANCYLRQGEPVPYCAPVGRPLIDEPQVGIGYAVTIHTHCGLRSVEFDGDSWAIEGPLDDGSSNPPPGFGNPQDRGVVTLLSPDEGIYLSEGGVERVITRGGGLPPVEGCI